HAMAHCPLCAERPSKRYCPAKETKICSTCCGSKREIEIDCPSTCSYLQAGRNYEVDRRVPDPQLAARIRAFDNDFIRQYNFSIEALSLAVAEERTVSVWLMDVDVIEVLEALSETMKTLSNGIYYERLPEGNVRSALFHRLKRILEELMRSDSPGSNSP